MCIHQFHSAKICFKSSCHFWYCRLLFDSVRLWSSLFVSLHLSSSAFDAHCELRIANGVDGTQNDHSRFDAHQTNRIFLFSLFVQVVLALVSIIDYNIFDSTVSPLFVHSFDLNTHSVMFLDTKLFLLTAHSFNMPSRLSQMSSPKRL